MPVRFQVEAVFTLRRTGVSAVATGRLVDGTVSGPIVLVDEATGAEIRVRGIDQLVSRNDPDLTPLLIEAASPTRPEAGMVLVEPT